MHFRIYPRRQGSVTISVSIHFRRKLSFSPKMILLRRTAHLVHYNTT